MTNEEFKEGMRKAQIIDLREKEPFKRKHIDGARSLPYTMLKYQYNELRSDLPVYLYSDSNTITLRAARFLKKKALFQSTGLRVVLRPGTAELKSLNINLKNTFGRRICSNVLFSFKNGL